MKKHSLFRVDQFRRVVLLCSFSSVVIAEQSEEMIMMPELMVTADKQELLVSDASAHVSVLTADQLLQEGVSGLSQLEGRFSGLSFQPFGQSGVNSPVMRGLTSNFNAFSSSTLLLVDGVPTLMAQGFDNNLLGVDRVELLRGPQTTVYGHNAQAGVLSIYSNDLSGDEKTRLGLEVGSRHKRVWQFATSQSLNDAVRVTLAAEGLSQEGFIEHANQLGAADDRERQSLSAGFRWVPNENTDLTLRYRETRYDDGASLWGAVDSDRASVASGTPSWNRSKGQTLSASFIQQLDPETQFHSVTAYNRYQDNVQQDTDFQTLDISHIGRDHTLRTLSQEFRLEGAYGRSDWLVGAYLEQQDHDLHTYSKTYFGRSDVSAELDGKTYAVFTNWVSPISDHARLVYGVRWSYNQASLTPDGERKRSEQWSNTSPQLKLEYDLAANHLLYLGYAKGVRSGGFNTLSPAVDFTSFDPEEIQSVELGIKGELDSSALRYNVSAYHMSIDDMQVMQMPSIGVVYLTNAAKGRSQGVEASIEYYLDQHWSAEFGIAWNNTRFDQFTDADNDYAGKRNAFTPKVNGHITLNYEALSGWSASASVVANGATYLDAANLYEQDGYEVINITGQYPVSDQIRLSVYVNNLLDKEFDAVGYQNGYVTVYSPPRELGLKLVWQL